MSVSALYESHHTAMPSGTDTFLNNLGLKSPHIHRSFDHFDFQRGSRIILVIGPMGSGKTEFVARVWRDSLIAQKKSNSVKEKMSTQFGADRRKIFVVKNALDKIRFPNNPDNSLSYRGGYIKCGTSIDQIADSFALEAVIEQNPQYGTWIIDEAGFYDERIAFIIKKYAQTKELLFICPMLSLNYRKSIFNTTASILVEYATDIFPLSAYCEHHDCMHDAVYTYRYYTIHDSQSNSKVECPAFYFDPLIMVGGDSEQLGDYKPNYAVRCAEHHILPGKEYTYMTLKPLATAAIQGDAVGFINEISALKNAIQKSLLFKEIVKLQSAHQQSAVYMHSLSLKCIAERALMYVYAEKNIINERLFLQCVNDFNLDKKFLYKILLENGRVLQSLAQ